MTSKAKKQRRTMPSDLVGLDVEMECVDFPREKKKGEWKQRDVRVKVVADRAAWEALHKEDPAWGGVMLDDGRCLCVRIQAHDDRDERGHGWPEDAAWCAGARKLRNKIMTLLEDDPETRWMDVAWTGNGCGLFNVEFAGANALHIAIYRDPHN